MAKVSVAAPAIERQLLSDSPEQTTALGVALGELLRPGDFIGLSGELGAGKTHFTRGVAEGAGVDRSQVASPSFSIVYPYKGRVPLYHADLFRVADHDELYATGFFDLAGEGALLVEWLDKVPSAAPRELLWLTFEVVDDQSRRIHARAFGQRPAELLFAWLSSSATPSR